MSTPTEHDTEALAEVLLSTRWPDGGLEGLPSLGTATMLATDLLASDWLAERDAALIAKAKAEGWDEGYSHCFDLGPNEVRSLDDNPYRAAGIEVLP